MFLIILLLKFFFCFNLVPSFLLLFVLVLFISVMDLSLIPFNLNKEGKVWETEDG